MIAYIIRLKNNELSERLAADVYKAALDFNFQPEYFDAINKDNVLPFFDINRLKIGKDKKLKSSLGTMGCFASHYSLWHKTVTNNATSIILEHDGVIIRDFKDIVEQVHDVCHLDPHDPYSTTYFDDVQRDGKLIVQPYRRAEDKKKQSTGGYFRGAYGYILTPVGAQKLINFVADKGCFTADRTICENAVELQQTSIACVRLHEFFDSDKKIKEHTTRF